MTSLVDPPLYGVAIYNPDLLSKQELVAQFVARRPLLQRLLEDLGREGTNQHHLLVGQRGMGKTTLLRRIRYAIEDDAKLSATWLPLTFPEEQYNVARLSDLYLNCVDALGDALDRMGRSREARELDAAVAALPDRDERERTKRALEVLLHGADLMKRRLLLLVDNVDLVFERLKGEQWAIRELLSSERRVLLIGASAVMLEATYEYKEPFYDFFQIHEIGGLSEAETREVLLNLAGAGDKPAIARVVEEDPARIKTFHVLAGGNPRTVVMLYDVLAKGVEGDVRADLERLLDRVTPLYKARFEAMPAQSQQVVDALAIHWDPMSAAELAAAARLEVNAVSSQLNRLEKQGVVEKVAYHPSSKAGFQVAERFFNIWYLMRASRRVRQRLIWLVEFLRLLYGREQIRGQAERHLRGGEGKDAESRMRRAEYGFALAQVVEDAPMRGALESVSVHALAMDGQLRGHLDPTFADSWWGLGNLLQVNLGRYQEAEFAYRRAIDLDPTDAHPWHDLGHLLQDHLDRREEAEAAYRKAIELDPTFAYPWQDLGHLLGDGGRYEEAEAACRKACELDPTDARAWSSAAWLRYKINKIDSFTEDVARRAVTLAPTDPFCVHTLATVLAARDNWLEAEPLARRSLAEGSADFHERAWPDIVLFFREAARTGHAAGAVRLLDDLGFADRWRPLREALAAIAAGSKLPLRRVAPEIRRPAEELLDKLWPQGLD